MQQVLPDGGDQAELARVVAAGGALGQEGVGLLGGIEGIDPPLQVRHVRGRVVGLRRRRLLISLRLAEAAFRLPDGHVALVRRLDRGRAERGEPAVDPARQRDRPAEDERDGAEAARAEQPCTPAGRNDRAGDRDEQGGQADRGDQQRAALAEQTAKHHGVLPLAGQLAGQQVCLFRLVADAEEPPRPVQVAAQLGRPGHRRQQLPGPRLLRRPGLIRLARVPLGLRGGLLLAGAEILGRDETLGDLLPQFLLLRPGLRREFRDQLAEDLIAKARPQIGVRVVPRVEADVHHVAHIAGAAAPAVDLRAEQPHEVALA